MIALGLILVILGMLLQVPILTQIGWIVLVIGLILMVLGILDRSDGPRARNKG
jgi:hypothetical protein